MFSVAVCAIEKQRERVRTYYTSLPPTKKKGEGIEWRRRKGKLGFAARETLAEKQSNGHTEIALSVLKLCKWNF